MPTVIEGIRTPIDGEPRNGAGLAVMVQDIADKILAARSTVARNWARGPDLAFAFSSGSGSTPRAGQGALGLTGANPLRGRWVFVGDDDGSDAFIADINFGQDFLTLVANPKAFSLRAVVFDPSNSKWVMAGDADGADAYLLNSPTHDIASVTERANPKNFGLRALATDGAGVVVAAGVHDGGDIYAIRSLDGGDTWAEVSIPGAAGDVVNGLAFGGPIGSKVFVAVGTSSGGAPLIWTSADLGVTWIVRTPAAGSTAGLNAVTNNGSAFVAAGDAGGEMQTSVDGITWTLRALSIATFGTGFVASDDDGVLLTNGGPPEISLDDGATWAPLSFARAGFVMAGAPWGFAGASGTTTDAQVFQSLVSR